MILYFKEGKWLDKEHTRFEATMLTDYYNTLNPYVLGIDTEEYKEIQEKEYKLEEFYDETQTDEYLKKTVIDRVQSILDSKAQERGYDNSFTLASYATSTVPKFKQEAQDFIAWRDAVWTKCYSMLDDYLAGNIARRTVDGVIQQLPTLEWTNEN